MTDHQHAGMTLWQIFVYNTSTMMTGGMLQGKFPLGSSLGNYMCSFAEPTLVCKVLSPCVLYRTVVSESDGRRKKGLMVQDCFTERFPGTHCFHTGPYCFSKWAVCVCSVGTSNGGSGSIVNIFPTSNTHKQLRTGSLLST